MKTRHWIAGLIMLFTFVTGGPLAGAFLVPPSIGAELEFSSLERDIARTNEKVEALALELEKACAQLASWEKTQKASPDSPTLVLEVAPEIEVLRTKSGSLTP